MKKFLALLALAIACHAQNTLSPTPTSLTAAGSITTAGTGTDCSIAASCVWIVLPSNASAESIQLSGTFSATLAIEQSVNGSTWTSLATQTAAGTYPYVLYGAPFLRVRASTYSSGPISVNIAATTGSTNGQLVAKADLTAQAASLGATTLYTVPASGAGTYRFTCYVVLTQAATTSSTLPACVLSFTDNDTNTAVSGWLTNTLATNTVGATNTGEYDTGAFNAKAGTAIQFSTSSYASTGATVAQYAIHAKVEFLGQ